MDRFLYDSVLKVASIMPISKNRHENCCRETDNKKIKDKELSFGEVLDKAIRNRK